MYARLWGSGYPALHLGDASFSTALVMRVPFCLTGLLRFLRGRAEPGPMEKPGEERFSVAWLHVRINVWFKIHPQLGTF